MIKVKLQFTLVGKSEAWKRGLSKHENIDFNNRANLDAIIDIVAEYFGNRALVVEREEMLVDDAIKYPEYYSAGWFISEDDAREIVIISHGDTMANANKSMLAAVGSVDWETQSARI